MKSPVTSCVAIITSVPRRKRHPPAAALVRVLAFAPYLLWLAAGLGCDGDSRASTRGSGSSEPLYVVTTTGMIADLTRQITGDGVRVESLMEPGVDPHVYKARESDVRRLTGADIILYNGLHLEGKLGAVLGKLKASRPVVAIAESLPGDRLLKVEGLEDAYDPHVWFDVSLWALTIDPIVKVLCERAPESAERFRANAVQARARLEALDKWVVSKVAALDEEQRVLVTAHDAFGYFGRRYGFRVVGIQGISTASRAGLADIARVTKVITENRVKAVFVESSVPRRNVEAVQEACRSKGHAVKVADQPLYSDSMGPPGSNADSYDGMVRHNVTVIVESLR